MRNLAAHHDDKVDDDLVWTALAVRVPEMARRLAVDVLGP
jgi:uncharacterized protein with HEPN domain